MYPSPRSICQDGRFWSFNIALNHIFMGNGAPGNIVLLLYCSKLFLCIRCAPPKCWSITIFQLNGPFKVLCRHFAYYLLMAHMRHIWLIMSSPNGSGGRDFAERVIKTVTFHHKIPICDQNVNWILIQGSRENHKSLQFKISFDGEGTNGIRQMWNWRAGWQGGGKFAQLKAISLMLHFRAIFCIT